MKTPRHEWIRCSKANKCPICHKDDWCTYNPKRNIAYCMRVESTHAMKQGGWIHRIIENPCKPRPEKLHLPNAKLRPFTRYIRDIETTWVRWAMETTDEMRSRLAIDLGVDLSGIKSVGAAWSWFYRAWAFPMVNESLSIIGARLRFADGKKLSLKGSKNGLFASQTNPNRQDYVIICEGATDACAASGIGFHAIGRPACNCGNDYLMEYMLSRHLDKMAIISDNDKPGHHGAIELARQAIARRIETKIVTLPQKDLREFVRVGGNKGMLNSYIANARPLLSMP